MVESCVDGILNFLLDFFLSVCEYEDGNIGKDVMSGFFEEDKFIELFELVV